MPKVKAITVTSSLTHPGVVRLQKSAEFWGWDLTTWPQHTGWERFTYRAEQEGLIQAMNFLGMPEWVLYMDAWDTLFTGPPQELPLQREKVAFCGDKHCFPTELWKDVFPQVMLGEFPHLNAGVFWGWGPTIYQLCGEFLQLQNSLCNQDFFNLRYIYEHGIGSGRLSIDHSAQVALNMWGMDPRYQDITRVNRRLFYKPTKTTPLVVHAAGTSTFHDVPPMPPQAGSYE